MCRTIPYHRSARKWGSILGIRRKNSGSPNLQPGTELRLKGKGGVGGKGKEVWAERERRCGWKGKGGVGGKGKEVWVERWVCRIPLLHLLLRPSMLAHAAPIPTCARWAPPCLLTLRPSPLAHAGPLHACARCAHPHLRTMGPSPLAHAAPLPTCARCAPPCSCSQRPVPPHMTAQARPTRPPLRGRRVNLRRYGNHWSFEPMMFPPSFPSCAAPGGAPCAPGERPRELRGLVFALASDPFGPSGTWYRYPSSPGYSLIVGGCCQRGVPVCVLHVVPVPTHVVADAGGGAAGA
eukprot:360344-Chlamydomonas_euryale.AAC.3